MFNEQLKKYRELQNLTQQQVANYLCITQACYNRYEKGIREPSLDILKKICNLFECTPDELLEFECQPNRNSVQVNNSFNNSSNINFKIK